MLGVHRVPLIEGPAAALGLPRLALAGGFDGRWPPFDPPGAKIIPFPLDKRRGRKPADDATEPAPDDVRRPEPSKTDRA